MKTEPGLERILDRAMENRAATGDDGIQLLDFDEGSPEAGTLMAAANFISRRRFGSRGVLRPLRAAGCCSRRGSSASFAATRPSTRSWEEQGAFVPTEENKV